MQISGRPTPPSAVPVNPATGVESTATPAEPTTPAPSANASAESAPPKDVAETKKLKSHHFKKSAVAFPEMPKDKPQKLAGFGEIFGGIGLAMVGGGAPSKSFSPVIENADKLLKERRTPEKKPQAKVETEVSNTEVQNTQIQRSPQPAPQQNLSSQTTTSQIPSEE